MEAEIVSICLVQSDIFNVQLAYVSLMDYPLYSLNVVDLGRMETVCRLSLHGLMECTQMKDWYELKQIQSGSLFDSFSAEKNPVKNDDQVGP